MRERDRKTRRTGPGAKPGETRELLERRERFERARRAALQPGPDGPAALYGWHTVKAALENPERRFRKLLVPENAARRLTEERVPLPLTPDIVRPTAIAERLSPDAVHQGIYAEADPLPSPALGEIAGGGIVLMLDQITDPDRKSTRLNSSHVSESRMPSS